VPYKVTRKFTGGTDSFQAPGDHYHLVNEAAALSDPFRLVNFYCTPRGREVATYGQGMEDRLAPDGDLFRQVKAAVEAYDQEHAEPEIRG
jgi:hypothetical protein